MGMKYLTETTAPTRPAQHRLDAVLRGLHYPQAFYFGHCGWGAALYRIDVMARWPVRMQLAIRTHFDSSLASPGTAGAYQRFFIGASGLIVGYGYSQGHRGRSALS